jgi:SPP1 family predicted phage head-tail adaptor
MTIGDLQALVDLQLPSGTSGEGYATTASAWAHIRSAGGNELLKFGAQVAVNATVITMRHRTDVKPDWRISWPSENRTFQIVSYGDETGDQHWLTVYATELLQ